MRAFVLGLFLFVAVLFPNMGNAQVYQFRTPPPEVTAAGAEWQIGGAPVLVGGLVYYATHGFRFFDGQVMAQVGLYQGVPVYADTTIEPNSVVYVPIGRDRMREYERRRDGELAGTTGSRTPSFPVESPSDQALRYRTVGMVGTTGIIEPSASQYAMIAVGRPEAAPYASAAGTSGTIDRRAMSAIGTAGIPNRDRPRRTLIESISRPSATNGVWLEFDGVRWYSSGAARSFTPDRFEPVGMYRGFPVYREKDGNKDEIWVSVVQDGPLAPYVRR
jgi:hypothetical protein